MTPYNGEFNKMQEEALERLREMQRRSKTAVNTPPTRPQSSPRPPEQPRPPASAPARRQDIFSTLFGDMKIDSEKALILLMLFVLYKNKADIKLLLALGYLLM